jgi:hypothetical protein
VGFYRQVCEEPADLFGPHLCRVTLVVEEDKAPEPVTLGFLGAQAEVSHPRD